MNNLKDAIQVLLREEEDTNYDKLCNTHMYASLIVSLTALVMTIQNIRTGAHTMTIATSVMVVGFGLNMIIAGVLKNLRLSSIVFALLSGITLSAFILGGGNQGFACLWVLIVPMVAVMLLGVVPGVGVSVYFLVFILVLFYTPLRSIIAGKYTAAHMQRFPVLYTCDMALSLYTSLQKEYYMRKLREKSFYDELTGAYNRNYFLDLMEKTDVIGSQFLAIIMIDLNGLKTANDTKGHAAGDELLVGLVTTCKKVFGKNVRLFRVGGDEFTLVLDQPQETVKQLVVSLIAARDQWHGKLNKKLEFALGCATKEEFPDATPSELMHEADQRMYADKAAFYVQRDRRGT